METVKQFLKSHFRGDIKWLRPRRRRGSGPLRKNMHIVDQATAQTDVTVQKELFQRLPAFPDDELASTVRFAQPPNAEGAFTATTGAMGLAGSVAFTEMLLANG